MRAEVLAKELGSLGHGPLPACLRDFFGEKQTPVSSCASGSAAGRCFPSPAALRC
ncbi:hypothetical protein [Victivallis lenta]|uniref:hypothetical protein n=1 Tax=Victivallis lenta TaxID=2606640 RepID=UPI0012B27ED0|nr:hypothetical protein [Victivallis lenta]